MIKLTLNAQIQNRETRWLSQYAETHLTAPQLARLVRKDRQTVLRNLPEPDLKCPFGKGVRLWEKNKALAHLKTIFGG